MKIGVLALQGAFREHLTVLERCGAEAVEVRQPGELEGIGGLILPGGESTTIGKLMVEWDLMETIRQRTKEGMAVYGTCAGMILLAKSIVDSDQPRLGLMDTTVRRNAFGRQLESFEEDLTVPELAGGPVRAVFIRAPLIEEVGSNVAVMAQVNGKAVIARQDNMLVTSFHPELTGDDRIHRYFLNMIKQE
ncbi:pyridoxal 5'-phosphate synthase glutaminase subunit PdxT [Propionispora hippei]|uniref:Pyridoxal 5'-phosphate synthase subunit PdxT n=1 Tax=Propionispora hippei DSM 15287 TaxID=1123003 RepID=A0A1M6J0C5_9FIRM|nr:pyridoxal 5'-phosphate synthase glutaminase subunit PdxT [Propionispora hippei]SHJ40100.1 5'-phosphate synthase pdxT subunit [Propionispora hippei DSM 15287]